MIGGEIWEEEMDYLVVRRKKRFYLEYVIVTKQAEFQNTILTLKCHEYLIWEWNFSHLLSFSCSCKLWLMQSDPNWPSFCQLRRGRPLFSFKSKHYFPWILVSTKWLARFDENFSNCSVHEFFLINACGKLWGCHDFAKDWSCQVRGDLWLIIPAIMNTDAKIIVRYHCSMALAQWQSNQSFTRKPSSSPRNNGATEYLVRILHFV